MVHNLHILFFLYRSKSNEKGTSPIFCRLTLDKKRRQFSTGHFAKETNWNNLKVSDYPLSEIKLTFLSDLDHYLKVEKGQNQNTINKVIERVKKQ